MGRRFRSYVSAKAGQGRTSDGVRVVTDSVLGYTHRPRALPHPRQRRSTCRRGMVLHYLVVRSRTRYRHRDHHWILCAESHEIFREEGVDR